jgi:hypothetical protein
VQLGLWHSLFPSKRLVSSSELAQRAFFNKRILVGIFQHFRASWGWLEDMIPGSKIRLTWVDNYSALHVLELIEIVA